MTVTVGFPGGRSVVVIMRMRFAGSFFERDRGFDVGFADDEGDTAGEQTRDESGEQAPQQQVEVGSGHRGPRSQWHGRPRRCRPSCISSCMNMPVREIAPDRIRPGREREKPRRSLRRERLRVRRSRATRRGYGQQP